MAPLPAGEILGHYRILAPLGQGGQATAYKAEDVRLGRFVVIKMLLPEQATTDTARRRFEREARLCSALDHPNVCSIYDIGEAGGQCYLVMQYVEGRTLKDLMDGRPLDVPTALSLAIQIADALAAAHARSIVHRDVKPTNVMVGPEGQVKVVDFGLAKMLDPTPGDRRPEDDDITELGTPYGSLGYGSPEQVSGDRVDHRTDVWSLGVLVYEMATGRSPFPGRSRLEVLRAVVNGTPRPIADLNPLAPPELQRIVGRALAKSPSDRYPTMAAMREDLRALGFAARASAVASPAAPMPGATTPRPRSSWLLSGALGRVFARRGSGPPPGPSTAGASSPAAPSSAAGGMTPGPEPDRPAIDSASAGPPAGYRPPSWGTETARAIAVLPFRNLAGDPEARFYELSLADSIITELAHVRSLAVRPSSYIACYVGRDVDPRAVGEELAVSSVLVGSFLRVTDRFRVTAQLVATVTGQILWSDKIDIPARDLFTMQDTVAACVIAGLRLRLTTEEQGRLDRPLTRNAEAYECYLRGRDLLLRYVLHSFDDADLDEAVAVLGEAVRLDPDFALAHAALGRCYVHHGQGYGGPEYFARAEAALQQALALDPALIEARLQMVHVHLQRGDKARAHAIIAELRREAPNDPAVIFDAARLYRLDGLYDRALAEYDRLLEVNPRDVVIVSYSRARIYTHQRQYARAIAELERAARLEPDHPLVKTFLAVACFNQGNVDRAQPLVEDVLRHHPHLEGVKPVLAWCLSARGQHAEARALITEGVREIAGADHDIAFWLAGFYALEGMTDEALAWLRRAIDLGNENYPLFADSDKLARLRPDPRFTELMRELEHRWEARRRAGVPGEEV